MRTNIATAQWGKSEKVGNLLPILLGKKLSPSPPHPPCPSPSSKTLRYKISTYSYSTLWQSHIPITKINVCEDMAKIPPIFPFWCFFFFFLICWKLYIKSQRSCYLIAHTLIYVCVLTIRKKMTIENQINRRPIMLNLSWK